VSTDCHTPWGQGSHKENATFFDFSGAVLDNGGMDWFGAATTSVEPQPIQETPAVQLNYLGNRTLSIKVPPGLPDSLTCQVFSIDGKGVASYALAQGSNTLRLSEVPPGQYVALVQAGQVIYFTRLIPIR
jgi:arabinogalactan endo-1,4-beta-galactosidase